MDDYRCQPLSAPLDATVRVPGSRSLSNRALVMAALADGTSVLSNILPAEDTELMIEGLRALGVAITVDRSGETAEVSGCGGHLVVDGVRVACGNAGTVMRFLTSVAAVSRGTVELHGRARMHERPIGSLVTALRDLGAAVEYLEGEGFPPLRVHGSGLRGGELVICDPASSQMVSGLLMVAPLAMNDVMIEVRGALPSVPYVRMTTGLMDQFGVAVIEQYGGGRGDGAGASRAGGEAAKLAEAEGQKVAARFIVESTQRYAGRTLRIEPDASNATYFLAAAAIVGGRVTVEGLGNESLQGDVGFVDVLEQMGCTVERQVDRLSVVGPPAGVKLRAVDVDLNDMPDTVPTLAVLALFADGPTTIRNVANLRVKETDRLAALAAELGRMGAEVTELADGLHIVPPEELRPATIQTYDDHRMAMSFAVAGLKVAGLSIANPSCCGKTFPDFFERLERLGTPST